MPAQKPGGLYKITGNQTGFVEAVPSRAFRDGTGIFDFQYFSGSLNLFSVLSVSSVVNVFSSLPRARANVLNSFIEFDGSYTRRYFAY